MPTSDAERMGVYVINSEWIAPDAGAMDGAMCGAMCAHSA